ncbi:MAG TPA: DUF3347 domain-containing protein [Thermoanaerobaculia bacterium]|nr:DUF3347 domain-containing protein [Thermoanaerobaculia bacterium]
MKLRFLAVLALVATPLLASSTLFTNYEAVRQGLLKGSLKDAQTSAKSLAAEATKAKNADVAKAADAVAKSADLDKAREAFGPLSDELIKLRNASQGERPAVAYCPMVKKSWLQSKSDKIGNPYDAAMKECGMFKKD